MIREWISSATSVACIALALAAGGLMLLVKAQKAELVGTRMSLQATVQAFKDEQKAREASETALTNLMREKQRVAVRTQEIIREVQVRVPVDACPLPPAWGVLHDAAARAQLPAAPGGPDGGPTGAAGGPAEGP